MKEFKLRFTADVADIEAQFKGAASELKKFAAGVASAENQLEALQQTGAYLAQMDKQLSELKKKYPDIFKQIFGNVDKQMKEAMRPLMQMPKEMGTLITKIGKQLDGIRSGKIEATNSEMKALGETFRGVAKALDMQVDLSFLDGTSKAKTKADKLIATMEQLAKAYYNVHKAQVNTGISLTVPEKPQKKSAPKKKTVAEGGSGGSGSDHSRQTIQTNKDEAISYDELTQKIERYIEISSRLENLKDKGAKNRTPAENKELALIDEEISSIEESFEKLKSGSSNILYDLMGGDIDKDNAISQLMNLFDVQLPQAVRSGAQQVKKALDGITDQTAKVMYHLGNLLNGKGSARDTFDDMTYNLTEAAVGTKWEDIGYGIFGGGLFGSANPSQWPEDTKAKGTSFIQSIDLSKYNMYMADTEERAANLADFLSKLQKFAIKNEVPDFKGFDGVLSGVSVDTLYNQFEGLFENTDMTKEKFAAFINEMQSLLREAEIQFDKETEELFFAKRDSEILSSENISTRLLKQLGYQGVYTGETSYGDLGQGSVLFDFDESDIIGYFNTLESAVQDYERMVNNIDGSSWNGSIKQLEQYRTNIDEIIARFEEFKNKFNAEKQPEMVQDVDEQIAKLKSVQSQVQQRIDASYSPTESSGGSLAGAAAAAGELERAVEGDNAVGQQLVQTLTNVGQAADGASASINNLGDEVDEALAQETGNLESKLERLRDLAEEYGMQITQRDRNSLESLTDQDNEKELTGAKADRFYELQEKVDAADESLIAFGEQYDKIILKLENGKSVEILPDDKGLRDLYKFIDEGDGRAFNGIDVSDIEFVRKAIEGANADGQQLETTLGDMRQAGEAAGQRTGASIDELNAKIEKEKQLTQEVVELQRQLESVPANPVDASELESAQREIKNLREEALRLEGALDSWKSGYYDMQESLDRSVPISELDNMTPNDVVDSYRSKIEQLSNEVADLTNKLAQAQSTSETGVDNSAEVAMYEALKQKLIEVTAEINAKTEAFKNEGTVVNTSVGAEIEKLEELQTKLTNISKTIDSINKINLGDGAGNINSNITVEGFEQLTSSIKSLKTSIDNAPGVLRSKSGSSVTENPHMLTDQHGNVVTAYRGINGAYSGLVSNRYHGGTFSTDNIELAKEYAGILGKIEKINLSMKNPLEIDGNGSYWNKIEYIGTGIDEVSKKLHQLNIEIKLNEELASRYESLAPKEEELDLIQKGFILETETEYQKKARIFREKAQELKEEKESIFSDNNNPYGLKNTNEIVEIAKSLGNDGVIFKNIIDSATGKLSETANVMVTFTQDQIHYLETISTTFSDAINLFKKQFGDLSKSIGSTDKDIRNSINKILELKSKLNSGDISEEEYNSLLSKDNVAIDFDKIIKAVNFRPEFVERIMSGMFDQINLDTFIDGIIVTMSRAREQLEGIAKGFNLQDIPLTELINYNADTVLDEKEQKINQNTKAQEAFKQKIAETTNSISEYIDKLKTANKVQGENISPNDSILPDYVQQALPKLEELKAKLGTITNNNDLNKWKQEWNDVVKSITQAKKEQEGIALSSQKTKLSGIKKSITDAYKGAAIDIDKATDEQKVFAQSYDELSSKLTFYAKNRRVLSNDEMAALEKEAKAIKEKANAYAKQADEQKKAENAYGTKEIKTAQSKKEKITGVATSDKFSDSQKVTSKLADMNAAYDALIAKQKEFKPGQETEDDRIAFQKLANDFNKAYQELSELVNESERLSKNSNWSKSLNPDFDISTYDGMRSVLEDAVRSTEIGKVKIDDFNFSLRQLDYSVQNQDGSWSHFTAKLNATGTEIVGVNAKLKQTDNIFKRLFSGASNKFMQALTRFTGFDAFYKGINEVRKGIQYVKEIDLALTELKKVTDETEDTYANFLQTASKTSAVIGSTIADFTNATADFARLGYSISEATELAKAASVYKNVGDGIDSVEQATESIISTMKAFGIEADNSMAIVDKFNEVGK